MRKILKYRLLLPIFLILASCHNCTESTEQTDTPVVVTTADTPVMSAPNESPKDTIVVKKVAKPIVKPEELPLRNVGELVLKDGIDIYSNEEIAFRLLDSLLSEKRSSRDFYFKVFNKLMTRSGGALGDSIGSYALLYTERHPGEFLINTKKFKPLQMETWASNIGIELYLAEGDVKEVYNRSVKTMELNCTDCDEGDVQRLQTFNKMIWSTIEQNLEEQNP